MLADILAQSGAEMGKGGVWKEVMMDHFSFS